MLTSSSLQRETAQTTVKLRRLTSELRTDRLPLEQWQSRFTDTLRAAHLSAAEIAADGTLTPPYEAIVDEVLAEELDYLSKFADDLASGQYDEEVSPVRYTALERAGLYAAALALTYSRATILTRQSQGHTQAWRRLNALARSCKQCVEYQTFGWVGIDEVVAIGHRCACRGRCKCHISFR
ncbi:hypothetical protein IQ268_08955 [Oculatella sp. LEGE 06141]|uniref:hypothetical protein n=1 Tax=Oculatella sp. LEGE 06141 TaxID=1828648 RepID=UPI00187F11EB|nr:hypothetical protein [Oculatella sp. LEGE 06141]MBE9178687.1 hypothetical protein [Oculatella sp. LEGE 06141]